MAFLGPLARAQGAALGRLPSLPEEERATYLPAQPRPPRGERVLAEPGRAPAAPLPGGGLQNLHVRVAQDPVHTEGGRLSGLACLGAAHAC